MIESIGHDINLEKIELIEFSMIDSRAVDLKFLYDLATLVQNKVNDEYVDGVVVIHGTGTYYIYIFFHTFMLLNLSI